jgi:hypothetical protein
VTFRLQISCDAPECDATTLMDDDHEFGPVTTENLPERRRAMFVIDTSWVDTPEGWMFSPNRDGGLLCPAHSGVAVTR